METIADKILKELVWKLDREVWAHVRNPEPSDEWSTSKAREESRTLIAEYIGKLDEKNERIRMLEEEIEHLSALRRNDKAWIENLEAKLRTEFCTCNLEYKTGSTSAMHCNQCGKVEQSETWLKPSSPTS